MRRWFLSLCTLLATIASAQQPLPPGPPEGPGFSDTAPGTMLVESGKIRNLGMYTMLGTTVAAYAISRSKMEDKEGTALSVFGCGLAIGITFNLVGNGKQIEAGRAMQRKGY